ncbi:MAG: hypothetical protein ACR2OZ_11760 [Verrucomicrobiales bacterium]
MFIDVSSLPVFSAELEGPEPADLGGAFRIDSFFHSLAEASACTPEAFARWITQ